VSAAELLGELVADPVEGDVPEPVVDRLGDEHRRRRRRRKRRPRDLGEGHAVDPVRVVRGQGVADDVSRVMAGDGESLVAERVHERDQVVGKRAGVVPIVRLVGEADPALVDCDHLEVPGQRRHHEAPRVPVLGPAMHEQQRWSVTPDDRVLAQPTGRDIPARERVGEPLRETWCTRGGARAVRRHVAGHVDLLVLRDPIALDGRYGDEAWDVDYFLHENPELKRTAFAWMTDFVGWLPMPEGGEPDAFLTADYNAEMIEHVERFPRIRDAAIFVGNPMTSCPTTSARACHRSATGPSGTTPSAAT